MGYNSEELKTSSNRRAFGDEGAGNEDYSPSKARGTPCLLLPAPGTARVVAPEISKAKKDIN